VQVSCILQNVSERSVLLISLIHLKYILVRTKVNLASFLGVNLDALLLIAASVLPHEVKSKPDDKSDSDRVASQNRSISSLSENS